MIKKSHDTKPEVSSGLLTWTEIFQWQQNNEYITTGYRRASFSNCGSLKSVFCVHNETSNIWSHLLGACLFLCLTAYLTRSLDTSIPSTSLTDMIAIRIFDFCAVVCFILSTFNHVFCDHSKEMHKFAHELDHLGIVLVFWGSGVSSNYFGFYCDQMLRNSYTVLMTSTAIGCAIFTLQPRFRQPQFRLMRVLMYMFQAASIFAAPAHGLWLYGWTSLNAGMRLDHFIALAIIDGVGAALYALRIPERWYPKTFDLIGQSHNLMHVLVLVGALVRRRGLLLALEHWTTAQKLGSAC